MKLYFAPGACSFVPHAMLEIAGAAFEPVMLKLHKGEQHDAAYVAINPRGQVPVLQLADGSVITQIVAICSYLDAAYQDARFLPQEPLARAKALETLAWMNNTVHPTFTHIFMPQKFASDPAACDAVRAHNTARYLELLQELDALVAAKKTPWLFGESITPADLYVLVVTRWGGFAQIEPTQFKASWAHMQALAAHPAVAKTIERERMQLNLMAAA
jgi:glutathione S-transferase